MAKSAFARGLVVLFTLVSSTPITACGGVYKLGETEQEADVTVAVAEPDTSNTPRGNARPGDECAYDADCEDGNPCTTMVCRNLRCSEPIVAVCPDGFVCSELGAGCIIEEQDCGPLTDNDPCTIDSCISATGLVTHEASFCPQDDDVTTVEECTAAPNGTTPLCVSRPLCPDLLDEDPCTIDVCNVDDPTKPHPEHIALDCGENQKCEMGTCVFNCDEHSDCEDLVDGQPNTCTIDSCDLKTGTCRHDSVECEDGDPTTIGVCIQGEPPATQCEHLPTACTGGCESDDPCVISFCAVVKGEPACVKVDISADICDEGSTCVQGECKPLICASSMDCSDGIACNGEEVCELATDGFGFCTQGITSCEENEVCDTISDKCVLKAKCETDCDDGDDKTLDLCVEGECKSFLFPTCGGGTAFNPETGKCGPAKAGNCVNNTIQCQSFEQGGGYSAVSVCLDGNWFPVDICGGTGVPCIGSKCVEAPPQSGGSNDQTPAPDAGTNPPGPSHDLHGLTSENESGANGGKPDGKDDRVDWDGDCYCASMTEACTTTTAPAGTCASLSGGDCDEIGKKNHPGGFDWPDGYDNACAGGKFK